MAYRGMGGEEGGWVAKIGGWVAKIGGWVAKLVARLLAPNDSSLVSNPQTSLKIYHLCSISTGLANKL